MTLHFGTRFQIFSFLPIYILTRHTRVKPYNKLKKFNPILPFEFIIKNYEYFDNKKLNIYNNLTKILSLSKLEHKKFYF
jgi:hypothetical protein